MNARRAKSTEALRLEFDWWSRRVAERRDDLKTITQQLAGAIASAALLIGLFGAFRPEDPGALASGLFLGSLLPFVLIVAICLLGPASIQAVYAQRTDLWLVSEDASRIEELGAIVQPDVRQRLGRAIHDAGHLLYGATLDEDDWLIVRTQAAAREALDLEDTVDFAQSMRWKITALLGLEVAYLTVVTSITPFI